MKKLTLLLLFSPTACALSGKNPVEAPKIVSAGLEPIENIAGNSSCAKYSWNNRGKAPESYIKGMALTFAKAVCAPTRSDVALVSKARGLPESTADVYDSLSWYNSNFKKLGMTNDKSGLDTLRHMYMLLIGLGMRESSGKHCTGRDMSADFSASDTSESGLFQASWGASRKSPELKSLFKKYEASKTGCLLEKFSPGISCRSGDAKNWGTGEGQEWQALTKSCPAFATEYAAILVRVHGGTKGEFGPLRRKDAELRPECDSMLKQIQGHIESNPGVCAELK